MIFAIVHAALDAGSSGFQISVMLVNWFVSELSSNHKLGVSRNSDNQNGNTKTVITMATMSLGFVILVSNILCAYVANKLIIMII